MAVERFPQGRVGGVYDTVLDRLVETSETHFGVGAFSHEVGDTPVAAFGAAAGAIMTAPLGRLDTPIIDVQHPRSRCAGRGGQSMRQCAVAANQAAEKRRSRVEAQPSSGRSARHEQRLNCRDALIIDDPRRFVGDDCFGAFAPAGLPIDGVELSHSCIRRAVKISWTAPAPNIDPLRERTTGRSATWQFSSFRAGPTRHRLRRRVYNKSARAPPRGRAKPHEPVASTMSSVRFSGCATQPMMTTTRYYPSPHVFWPKLRSAVSLRKMRQRPFHVTSRGFAKYRRLPSCLS